MSTKSDQAEHLPPPTALEAKYLAVQKSPEFQSLRKRYRGWVFPVTIACSDLVPRVRAARRLRP